MTIAEVREKCKASITKIPRDVLIIAVLILASSARFGFGYLAGSTSSPQAGIDAGQRSDTDNQTSLKATAGEATYVASKNGTKYYLTTCAGASQISDANKVWFVSAADAEAAGYTRAASCK